MGIIQRNLISYHGISTCNFSDLVYFKQLNIDYMFCIPNQKPDIEQIVKVWVDTDIIDTEVIKTTKGTSMEGQNLTGNKLLVCGDIHFKFEYITCDSTKTVHSAHTVVPFCGYVVLPENINSNEIIKTSVVVEDIFSDIVDSRCIYNNITMMLVADIC